MITTVVPATSMSSLFDTRLGIEAMVEPYRLQTSVVVCVAYPEYVNYVRSLSIDSDIDLLSGTQRAVRLATELNPRLFNCYLLDLSFAICKEILFSEFYGEDATVIIPCADCEAMPLSKLFQHKIVNALQTMTFDNLLRDKNCYTKIKLPRNKNLKQLAYSLYAMSERAKEVTKLNLRYDL